MRPTLKPTLKQHLAYTKLFDTTTKYVVFGGGAGGGKTWLGCEWLITQCYQYPGTKWFIGREELKRLMSSSFITFLKVATNLGIPKEDWKLNGQYNFIEFTNGSRIDLLDLKYLPTDPMYERFGSTEYTGGWIEEAGEIDFMAFDVLKSRVGRHMNAEYNLPPKLLITCNPKKNWLYSTVYKPWKAGTLDSNYFFIQSLYSDNVYTAKTYGEQLADIKDKATKQRLMFGNWEYDSDPNALIDFDAIEDLFTNTVDTYEKYISCDVARYGSDKTVIYLWEGFKVTQQHILVKQGTDVVAARLRQLALEERVPYSHIVIDEDGIGGGVLDQVKGARGFIANTACYDNPITHKPENFQNLKAQCTYRLADMINARQLSFVTMNEQLKADLVEELEQIKSKDLDKDGKRRIVPKDEVKEVLGRSPDYADALMMRMVFEFKTPRSDLAQKYVTNYNSVVNPKPLRPKLKF